MGGFPALMIKPPESPVQQLAGVEQLKAGFQQQQLGEIQLQEARLNQISQQTLMESFAKNNGDFNQTYADAAASGKVTPSMLLDFRTKSVAAQTAAANLQDKQIDVLTKQHDLATNEIEAFRALPADQRTPEWLKGAAGRLANEGVDISKIIPQLQSIASNPTDENIRNVEIGLKGDQWVLNNEKAEREKAQAPTTPEVQATRTAALAETIANTNKAVQDTSLAAERQRQLGKVTDEEVYKQQQENYRATLARQATFANNLQKNGLEQLDKMFADPQHGYTQFISQAQATKNNIIQSRSGNELASNLEPLMLALGVTSYAGVHRINQTEVNAAGPEAGSLLRRLDSLVSKAGSGSVPADTLKEAEAIVDGLIDAKHASMVNGANMVVSNAGLDPKKTMVMDRSGVITSLDKAQSERTGGTTSKAPPAGATHIVPGPDGKKHYTNAAGTVDLGVAE